VDVTVAQWEGLSHLADKEAPVCSSRSAAPLPSATLGPLAWGRGSRRPIAGWRPFQVEAFCPSAAAHAAGSAATSECWAVSRPGLAPPGPRSPSIRRVVMHSLDALSCGPGAGRARQSPGRLKGGSRVAPGWLKVA